MMEVGGLTKLQSDHGSHSSPHAGCSVRAAAIVCQGHLITRIIFLIYGGLLLANTGEGSRARGCEWSFGKVNLCWSCP